MATSVPLPLETYTTRDPRTSSKRLVGFFAEPAPTDSMPDSKEGQSNLPFYLRRQPGISSFAGVGSGTAVRGAREMGGVQYVVIGPTLYSVSSGGSLTQIGTGIGGATSGLVRMMDNTQCLFILVPGTALAWTYCPNGPGFAPFTDATFLSYGAIDVHYVDTYFTFLMMNGRGFYNDDGQIVSGTGVPTFTSAAVFLREFGTDPFVGGIVDHREVLYFGKRTAEGYVNAGNQTGSPFSSAPDSFIPLGCHPNGAYTIVEQDEAPFWVAQDCTVRRRNGNIPQKVSTPPIDAILLDASNKGQLVGMYALNPTIDGHPLYVLTIPLIARTFVYDAEAQKWAEFSSQGIGYWRPLCWFDNFGGQFIGDSQGNGIGRLDSTVFTEFGIVMPTYFTTQTLYDGHNRISCTRVELVITAGNVALGSTAVVTLFYSPDGGYTWIPCEDRSIGANGQYQNRCIWWGLGLWRDLVLKFQISDPSPLYTVDIQVELDGGQY